MKPRSSLPRRQNLRRQRHTDSERAGAIPSYNLAIVGFGNVGREFLRLLVAKETEWRRRYDVRWRLTGVATRRAGWLADPDGLSPLPILNGHWPSPSPQPCRDVREWLEKTRADVLFEASSLSVQTGQPAIEHLQAALELWAHALTANKGPIVHAFRQLTMLAHEKTKKLLYEATVMDGVPIFSMFPQGLPATVLQGFTGVLNSTTNVVLTEIEKGRSFDEAVKRARAIGVVETDPAADLDGWDSAVKVAALAIVLMGAPVKLEQVQRTGIRDLHEEKIRSVRAAGVRYKLLSRAVRPRHTVACTVRPQFPLPSAPFAPLAATHSPL